MAIRSTPLISSQIYHIFNQTQPGSQPFLSPKVCDRTMQAFWYYQYENLPMKLSHYRARSKQDRTAIEQLLTTQSKRVTILAYCLMPNHYHLLIRQEVDHGISTYIGDAQNSITRFVNIKRKQKGHVFIGQFKAVQIESEDQLLHVSRYIHLNPYTGYVVKLFDSLITYRWSSYGEYVSELPGISDQTIILSHFKTKGKYAKFVEDQKGYQRQLANMKYLTLEDALLPREDSNLEPSS
jgi:putative transposase